MADQYLLKSQGDRSSKSRRSEFEVKEIGVRSRGDQSSKSRRSEFEVEEIKVQSQGDRSLKSRRSEFEVEDIRALMKWYTYLGFLAYHIVYTPNITSVKLIILVLSSIP